MCGWADTQTKYYLLGTPFIWWSGSISLMVSLFVAAVYILRMQRKYKDFDAGALFSGFAKPININILCR